MKPRVYLADLTHTGLGIATEAFPLNVGLIAAYAKKRFGSEVDVELFKLPEHLKEAIDVAPPDILGCSNYCWNEKLSSYFLQYARAVNPSVLTVFGGTNYPFDAPNQEHFLRQRPFLDMHVFYEGEQAFAGIIERYLGAHGRSGMFERPLAGVQFIRDTGDFVSGAPLPRQRELDEYPSPYTAGLLDRFFELKLTPLLETARGCPFACNFCNAGDRYYNKVNLFSNEYVRDEWEYVAKKAAEHGIGHMTLADNNFGMIPRDEEIVTLMKTLQAKYGWPKTATVWTGKNSKDRVIAATRLLGESLSISMSVQSLDADVLKNISRGNIKLDHYREISKELFRQGRPQHAELIIPLPGETYASHKQALLELVDNDLSNLMTHTLTILHGTPYKDDAAFIERYGYTNPKHRIVPMDFGMYGGKSVLDTEEVVVETKSFTFEEYVRARVYALVIDLSFNGDVFRALKRFIVAEGLKRSEWIEWIACRLTRLPSEIQAIFDSFVAETKSELWDSREALVEHYSQRQNYERLLNGDAGGNVLYRHKVWLLSSYASEWINYVFVLTGELMRERLASERMARIEILLDELLRLTKLQAHEIFDFENPEEKVTGEFSIDWLRWLEDRNSPPADSYARDGTRLAFSFDAEQLHIKRDAYARYGDHLSGKVKVVQRIGGIHRFLRRVSYAS